MILSANDSNAVKEAVSILTGNGLVAVPTETVYGLAAIATSDRAVARIFEAKNRPSFNPLICHVADAHMAGEYVVVNDLARTLMDHFWPGPLTLVLPALQDNGLSALVSAGLDTLAVRMPRNELTRSIIAELGQPIAAPSANPSGKISPTSARDVENGLARKVDLILDSGDCSEGLESTIVAVGDDSITLLRPGTVTAEQIMEATGIMPSMRSGGKISSPGQLLSHYAPEAPVRLNANGRRDGEFLIGLGNMDCDFNLSPMGDLAEAAARLFRSLHAANESGKPIAVANVPDEGLGIAINDRLNRAAAPRDKA